MKLGLGTGLRGRGVDDGGAVYREMEVPLRSNLRGFTGNLSLPCKENTSSEVALPGWPNSGLLKPYWTCGS